MRKLTMAAFAALYMTGTAYAENKTLKMATIAPSLGQAITMATFAASKMAASVALHASTSWQAVSFFGAASFGAAFFCLAFFVHRQREMAMQFVRDG